MRKIHTDEKTIKEIGDILSAKDVVKMTIEVPSIDDLNSKIAGNLLNVLNFYCYNSRQHVPNKFLFINPPQFMLLQDIEKLKTIMNDTDISIILIYDSEWVCDQNIKDVIFCRLYSNIKLIDKQKINRKISSLELDEEEYEAFVTMIESTEETMDMEGVEEHEPAKKMLNKFKQFINQ